MRPPLFAGVVFAFPFAEVDEGDGDVSLSFLVFLVERVVRVEGGEGDLDFLVSE